MVKAATVARTRWMLNVAPRRSGNLPGMLLPFRKRSANTDRGRSAGSECDVEVGPNIAPR